MTVEEELVRRELPDVLRNKKGEHICSPDMWELRRKELQEILCSSCYGDWVDGELPETGLLEKVLPERMLSERESLERTLPERELPDGVRKWEVQIQCEEENGCGGKAFTRELVLESRGVKGIGSFSFFLALPKEKERPPVFLYLSFAQNVKTDMVEELTDNGYAVAAVSYENISPDRDDGDYSKISHWAYGCSLIMDYLMTLTEIDTGRIAIVGHSRLGKAALLCGAMDRRFSMVIANESGAAGAALMRGKQGERIAQLRPYWFCPDFQKYCGWEEKLPYDQHFLLAMVAPRALYVASAREDAWADPESEFLSCAAISPVYEIFGKKGLVYSGFPACGDVLHEGAVGYHLRAGTHHLSRDDWHHFMEYRKRWGV